MNSDTCIFLGFYPVTWEYFFSKIPWYGSFKLIIFVSVNTARFLKYVWPFYKLCMKGLKVLRSSCLEMFCEKCLKKVKKIYGRTPAVDFLVFVRAFDFTEKELHVRCLPVNFANFSKKLFLVSSCLEILWWKFLHFHLQWCRKI